MKVSDFKVSEQFIRSVCTKMNISFVDVPLVFKKTDNDPQPHDKYVGGYSEGRLNIVVGPKSTLSSTLIQIISGYINKLSDITGSNVSLSSPEQVSMMTAATAIVRDFTTSPNNIPQSTPDSGLRVSLRNFPFVWLFLRDIIVPAYQVPLDEIDVLVGRSAQVDAAYLIKEGDEVSLEETDMPVIFVNTEVESGTYRSAYLLTESIRALTLDVPRVIGDLLNHSELNKKVYGYVKMAIVVEKEVEDFLLTLAVLGGVTSLKSAIDDKTSPIWFKSAQQGSGNSSMGISVLPSMTWFMPVLIEGLLHQTYGPDYDVARRLNPLVADLWDRVAKEKKRRGKDDMSFEDLLRVQSAGMRVDPKQTLQGLLAQERIW